MIVTHTETDSVYAFCNCKATEGSSNERFIQEVADVLARIVVKTKTSAISLMAKRQNSVC